MARPSAASRSGAMCSLRHTRSCLSITTSIATCTRASSARRASMHGEAAGAVVASVAEGRVAVAVVGENSRSLERR